MWRKYSYISIDRFFLSINFAKIFKATVMNLKTIMAGLCLFGLWAGSFDIFGVFTYRIDTVCISHDEMEYYYTNILNYYNQETSTILPTRAIMRTYVDTAVIPYSQPNLNGYPGDLWYWRIFIHYGKPNCTNSDPIK